MQEWIPELKLTEWIALYAAVAASAAMLWHFANVWRLWRDRDRVELRIARGGRKAANSPYVGWLNLYVKNCSPNHMFIEEVLIANNWAGGVGIPVSDQFPCEIEPFRTVKVEYFPISPLLDEAKTVFAVDGRGRRWKLRQRDLIRAIIEGEKIKKKYDEIGLEEYDIAWRFENNKWDDLTFERKPFGKPQNPDAK